MALSDLEILARLIQCEAGGEGENGMQAVASVIMNRVHITYGEYGRFNTIREVVFQQRQFAVSYTHLAPFCGAFNGNGFSLSKLTLKKYLPCTSTSSFSVQRTTLAPEYVDSRYCLPR